MRLYHFTLNFNGGGLRLIALNGGGLHKGINMVYHWYKSQIWSIVDTRS